VLVTDLEHLETEADIHGVLEENENVVMCCGRMGPMCIPVYRAMEQLEAEYPHVAFRDMDFDIPAAGFIRELPACASFMGLPFTVYFKRGSVVGATTSIQSTKQIRAILEEQFSGSQVETDRMADG
jgi:thioredoxin 1